MATANPNRKFPKKQHGAHFETRAPRQPAQGSRAVGSGQSVLDEIGELGTSLRRTWNEMGKNAPATLQNYPVGSVLVGFGLGVLTGYFLSRSLRSGTRLAALMDAAEIYRDSPGAVSAVTGGHPEDINGMPPADFDDPEAIYDGSSLPRRPRRYRDY